MSQYVCVFKGFDLFMFCQIAKVAKYIKNVYMMTLTKTYIQKFRVTEILLK